MSKSFLGNTDTRASIRINMAYKTMCLVCVCARVHACVCVYMRMRAVHVYICVYRFVSNYVCICVKCLELNGRHKYWDRIIRCIQLVCVYTIEVLAK